MKIMRKFKKLIKHIENPEIPIVYYIMFFFFVVTIRNFWEMFIYITYSISGLIKRWSHGCGAGQPWSAMPTTSSLASSWRKTRGVWWTCSRSEWGTTVWLCIRTRRDSFPFGVRRRGRRAGKVRRPLTSSGSRSIGRETERDDGACCARHAVQAWDGSLDLSTIGVVATDTHR